VADKLHAQTYLKFKENKIAVQDADSSNCGYFAAKFLIDRFRGVPFKEVTGYDDSVKGEKDIEAFKKRLGIKPFRYLESFGGSGFISDAYDRVVTFFTGRNKAPPAVRRLLNQVGQETIEMITVARSPVNSMIQKVINFISGGTFEANKQQLHYDQIYHLFLIIKTKSRQFTLERNETVKVGDPGSRSPEGMAQVDLGGKQIKVVEFLQNGVKVSKENFWQYNPVNNNCQVFARFVRSILAF
jgi:hypothetical protein